MQEIIAVCGAISGLAAAIYVLRKLYFWLKPVHIDPSFTLYFGSSGVDFIGATVTNQSPVTQYIVACNARGTYSLKYILSRHLRHPFIRPRLYPNVWYGGAVYPLMGKEPIKLEPQQLVDLKCELYEHPLNAMITPYFFVTVRLSSGKIISSKKLRTPGRWKMIGRNKEINLPNITSPDRR